MGEDLLVIGHEVQGLSGNGLGDIASVSRSSGDKAVDPVHDVEVAIHLRQSVK